jgi:hypothetical protein
MRSGGRGPRANDGDSYPAPNAETHDHERNMRARWARVARGLKVGLLIWLAGAVCEGTAGGLILGSVNSRVWGAVELVGAVAMLVGIALVFRHLLRQR